MTFLSDIEKRINQVTQHANHVLERGVHISVRSGTPTEWALTSGLIFGFLFHALLLFLLDA